MLDHAAYFFPPERCSPFDRLFRSDPALSVQRSAIGRSDVAATLRQRGIRVAVVDLTTPDVATGPFRVVRAVSPDLMALTFGGGLERLPPARVAAMQVTGSVPALASRLVAGSGKRFRSPVRVGFADDSVCPGTLRSYSTTSLAVAR